MMAVYEVTLGSEDGSSRVVRLAADSEPDAQDAAQNHVRSDETVIFVEAAELNELDDDGVRDHPEEGPDLSLAPAPKITDLR